MEKIYRVQMNSSGMPNFSTAVEIDTDISEYSDKLWKNAYERGKADRPQGYWTKTDVATYKCSECGKTQIADDINELNFCCCCGSRNKVRRVKGVDDE